VVLLSTHGTKRELARGAKTSNFRLCIRNDPVFTSRSGTPNASFYFLDSLSEYQLIETVVEFPFAKDLFDFDGGDEVVAVPAETSRLSAFLQTDLYVSGKGREIMSVEKIKEFEYEERGEGKYWERFSQRKTKIHKKKHHTAGYMRNKIDVPSHNPK